MGASPALIRIVKEPRAYLGLAYLLARFPLAVLYLAILLLGVVGILLFPLGLLVLIVIVGLGSFEREVASWWFDAQLRPMALPGAAGRGPLRRLRDLLANPVMWTSVAFVALEIPLGLLGFALTCGLLIGAAALVTAPFAYIADGLTFQAGDPRFSGLWLPGSLARFGVPATIGGLVLAAAAGAGLALATLHLARLAARGHVWLVGALLSVSAARLDLLSARAEAEAERERADRSDQARRQLVVNASHELRTPIASIRGHLDSLLDSAHEASLTEGTRHYLEVAEREAERLSLLVDDLLAVASVDSGELRLELTEVDVNRVARHIHGAMAPIADRDREVTLRLEVEEVGAGWADERRLGQVLANLVRNAIAYTPEGGIVSLEVRGGGPDSIELVVADTGIGIEAGDLERIFERFYRADASRARASGGFGLGLAISRDLVEAMGGAITVESQPGLGSRFTVRLRRVA
jgi:signal transduction histidine kinase